MSDWRTKAKIGLAGLDLASNLWGPKDPTNKLTSEAGDAYSQLSSQQHEQNSSSMNELRGALQFERNRPSETRKK